MSPAETGLYYLQSRYYDPALCRFLNADGYASTGQGILGCNMFAYCGNDPVCYIDDNGLKKVYVIVYNNPETGFVEQAENSPYYGADDEIITIEVSTSEDFLNAWNGISNYSNIDDVYLYVHGGKGVLYFKGSELSADSDSATFDDLENISINGRVYLFSCSGGTGGKTSAVAYIFAEKANASVRACTGHVSYSKIHGKYYARKSLDFGIWKNFYCIDNPTVEDGMVKYSLIGW